MALSAAQLEREWAVRRALVPYLAELQQRHPDALPRRVLIQRVELAGVPVNLMDPARGISKPSPLAAALSVMTAPPRRHQAPYDDHWISEDRLSYAYQGTDPQLYTNRALKVAWEHRLPLVYLYGVRPGEFLAEFPVYVERDRPEDLRVDMVFADPIAPEAGGVAIELDERRYSTRTTRSRLHQLGFRLRVLKAYEDRCAICRLGHPPLLDAAHIVPDTEPLGRPVTPNGLSLCKLHHSAYDRLLIGVTPRFRVEVARDVLDEQDGPMLRHGLQELHGQALRVLPASRVDRPRQELLEWRYERFREGSAGG